MYRDSYIVALMVGGKIQKEADDGTILIPFGSEYVIRLKNKLRKRAIADVWLDGRIAAKGIVLDANGTVDLERFVDDKNLSEGKRFKLARITDPKVEQPNDSENGSIEVNFYPEKDEPVIEKKTILEHINCTPHNGHGWGGHCTSCCNCYMCNPKWRTSYSGNITYGGTSTGGLSGGNIILTGNLSSDATVGQAVSPNKSILRAMNASFTASAEAAQVNQVSNTTLDSFALNNASMSLGEAAATVEGSTSLQKFSYVSVDVDRSKPTTIRLTVKGLSKVLNVCECGYKRKKDVKYCPNDGTQLVA